MVTKKSIQVAAITAHICTELLMFHRGVFGYYEDFSFALEAVIYANSSVSSKRMTTVLSRNTICNV